MRRCVSFTRSPLHLIQMEEFLPRAREKARLTQNETFTRLYESTRNFRDVSRECSWIWQRWWIYLLSPIKSDATTSALISLFFLAAVVFPSFVNFQQPSSLAILQARNPGENWPSAFGARKARAIPGKMRTRVIALWSRKKPRRWSNVARKHPSATREVWRSIDSMSYTKLLSPMMAAITLLASRREDLSRKSFEKTIFSLLLMYTDCSRCWILIDSLSM